MTEPEAGSDVGSLTTSAERVNGGFVINGQKVFMLQRPHLRPRPGRLPHHQGRGQARGPVDDLGPDATPTGMEIDPIDTMGGRETNHALPQRLSRRPRDAVLGEVDQGWTQLMAGLNVERLILAATMLGIGQRAFDDALAYVKERKPVRPPDRLLPGAPAPPRRPRHRARGGPADDLLGRLQGRRGPGPDAAPRGLDGEALRHRDRQKRVALEGMQMMGGYGYSSEYDMERLVRATLVSTIYGGTSEIQRNIIAKTLGL